MKTKDDRLVEHYIIVRVREAPLGTRLPGGVIKRSLLAGSIRRVIHAWFGDIEKSRVSDMIVRGDRKFNCFGVPEPTQELAEIFDRITRGRLR